MATQKPHKKVPQSPKKQAIQARSRQTVSNILEAARQIIETNGLKVLTTNKVAERSGVNIASIYQYFPNKQSIVNTLVEQVFSQQSQRISDVILALTEQPSIRESSETVIALAIDIFRDNQAFLTEILEQENREQYFGREHQFNQLFLKSGETFLFQRQDELRVADLNLALYILQNSVIPLLLEYLLNGRVGISDQEMVSEVSDLICSYLLK